MNYIIHSKKNELGAGMFGQTLTWLLEILNHLENEHQISNNSKIIFDVNANNYGNIIPTHIVPRNIYSINDLDNAQHLNIKSYKLSNGIDFEFNTASFNRANYIWNKYFKLHPDIEKLIPMFDMSNTLGIHFRGTDKNTDASEANPISQDEFITIIKDYLKNSNNVKNVYCCSDEASFITRIKTEFVDLNIIDYNQKRSENKYHSLHEGCLNTDIDKFNHTFATFIDVFALSKCNTVLKTSSAMSSFSKILNPDLNLITCCAMKQRWFPTGVVEAYQSSNEVVNNILKRTMCGHLFKN